ERLAQNDRVIAIIGPSTSGESIPLAVMADSAGIPLLSLAASRLIVEPEPGEVNPWAFKFAQNDDLAAGRLVSVMVQEGDQNVAFLYENSGFGKSGQAVFGDAVEGTGVSVQYESSFPAE